MNSTAIKGYVNLVGFGEEKLSHIGVHGEVNANNVDVKEAIGVRGAAQVTLPQAGAFGGRFTSTGSSYGRAAWGNVIASQSNGPWTGFGHGADFYAITSGSTISESVNNLVGVVGSASGVANQVTGVRGIATGYADAPSAIGVYGSATNMISGAAWAGYFEGNVYISGTYGPSDSLLKENIQAMASGDSLLRLLNPVTFDFKTSTYPQLNLQESNQMGLIAQEVIEILPEIVSENISPATYDSIGNEIYPSVNFKTVDYTKLIPLLVKGHKEQAVIIDSLLQSNSIIQSENDSLQTQITDLNNRLSQLENCLSGILPLLCQLSNSQVEQTQEEVQQQLRSVIDVELSNGIAIVLNQNVPNPFAESTVITFSIPVSVQDAQIIFHDVTGSLIKMVDIRERGNGQINVYANDLSSGVYTYSLVADGKIVATKRMVKQ